MSKETEIRSLREVVQALKEGDVSRSPHISRADNKALYAMAEQIENIIERMDAEYDGITTVEVMQRAHKRAGDTGESLQQAQQWVIKHFHDA